LKISRVASSSDTSFHTHRVVGHQGKICWRGEGRGKGDGGKRKGERNGRTGPAGPSLPAYRFRFPIPSLPLRIQAALSFGSDGARWTKQATRRYGRRITAMLDDEYLVFA